METSRRTRLSFKSVVNETVWWEESLCESRLFQQDHGGLGVMLLGGGGGGVGWCLGGWVNIRKRLAASSLGTKIHAGEEAATSILQERKNKEAGICQVSALLLPRCSLQYQLGLCQRTHAHQPLIWGQHTCGRGVGGWRDRMGNPVKDANSQSLVQMKILWVEVEVEGGGHRFPL